MKKPGQKLALNEIAIAVSMSLAPMGMAYAQAAKADTSTLNLDEVVITAAPTGRSKMKSSDSVSSVGEEQITRGGATNAAEILRAIPGLRAESSGGEGNANVTVRGAPVSAGGSRYVQFQEDGLPVLLFGDIAFGTPDQFMRVDYTTDRVEVVRGGSASTMVSNSPGAVINFISKTGKDAGNAVGVTMGLGSRLNRYDFNFGTSLGESTYLNMGGFFRQGEGGAHKLGFNAENGGQFKASLTKEFDKGYIRVHFKHLDDTTPSYMPVPVTVVGGNINTNRNIDPRTAYFSNSSLSRDVTFDKNGNSVVSNPADGLHVVSNSIGVEGKLDVGGGWTLEDKFRKSANSGRFVSMFAADNGNNGTAPNFTGTLFNTSLDNLGNMFNDLKLSKPFAVGGGKATTAVGIFSGSQTVAQTWFWNQYSVQANGRGAAISGPTSTGWNTWGGCCARTWDVRYTTNAPYASVNYEAGPLNFDGSVRINSMQASGSATSGTKTGTGATVTSGYWDPTTTQRVNYSLTKSAYSFGANYAIDSNTAAYARMSDGYNFAADRLLYGTPVDGTKPISYNRLQQQEFGVKARRGDFSAFGTVFFAKTNESNFEATTQKFTTNGYKASGIELEVGYRVGGFRLSGGGTYTNAKITSSLNAAEIGKKPRRQADFVYALTPSYRMGDAEFGAAFIGTSKSFGDDANTMTMPGYMVTNAFASYRFTKQLVASFSVNNLFNTLGYTEVEGDGHAARAVPGRSAKASLRYNF